MTVAPKEVLPNGWAMASIDDVVGHDGIFVDGDWVESKDQDPSGDVRLIQLADIGDGHFLDKSARFLTKRKAKDLKCTFLEQGDLLIARMPEPLGRSCQFPLEGREKFVTVVDVCAVRFGSSDVNGKYMMYLINSPTVRTDIEALKSGSTRKRISRKNLATIYMPIAPVNEQHRIVAKIEALISELDQGIENLQTARDQLNVYRQAVLMHAFEGKLTETWREGKKDELQTADDLRNGIELNRQKRYERQLEDWKTAIEKWEQSGRQGKKPVRPKKLKQLASLSDADKHADVPPNWCHIRLGSVIDEPKYGTSKKCDYGADGIGVLRIPNVANGVIDPTDLKFAEFDEDETEVFGLQRGDILTIRSNGSISLVGKCALVSEEDEQYLFAGYLIRLRPHRCVVRSDFLNAVLSSHELRKQIESKAKSTSGVNNINSGEIQDLIIPICGLAEQDEVVRILDEKLSIIDQMQSDIRKQLSVSSALRQSILKRALSGQLVEQDPNDEPASELLVRITAEKEERKKAKKAAKKKAKKKAKRKDAA